MALLHEGGVCGSESASQDPFPPSTRILALHDRYEVDGLDANTVEPAIMATVVAARPLTDELGVQVHCIITYRMYRHCAASKRDCAKLSVILHYDNQVIF